MEKTAEIVEMGFDTDTIKRYVVLKFTPPLDDGRTFIKMPYMAVTMDEDGLLPAPIRDEHEIGHLRTFCHACGGYELITD